MKKLLMIVGLLIGFTTLATEKEAAKSEHDIYLLDYFNKINSALESMDFKNPAYTPPVIEEITEIDCNKINDLSETDFRTLLEAAANLDEVLIIMGGPQGPYAKYLETRRKKAFTLIVQCRSLLPLMLSNLDAMAKTEGEELEIMLKTIVALLKNGMVLGLEGTPVDVSRNRLDNEMIELKKLYARIEEIKASKESI
jgi:hypothetical protein